MSNTPNSNPSLAKKRKLPTEPNKANPNNFPLELKSTKRSGDNVEVLNKELYKEYCEVINDDNLNTEDAASRLNSRIASCLYDQYYSNFDIQCMGIDAIRTFFVRSQESMQPIKLDIQALKSFSSEIAKSFEYSVNVVQLNMISLKGRVFISKISCLHSRTP